MPETSYPLIVFHYTEDNGYAEVVKNLIASLEALGLEYRATRIKSKHSWRENSNYCAHAIIEDLKSIPDDKYILRVDADAVFRSPPTLMKKPPFTQCDMAAGIYTFPWITDELYGGTFLFRNSEKMRAAIDHWDFLCNVNVGTKNLRNGDILKTLVYTYDKPRHPLFADFWFEKLPPNYFQIFDHMKHEGTPVIEQMQISRKLKNLVNTEVKRNKG